MNRTNTPAENQKPRSVVAGPARSDRGRRLVGGVAAAVAAAAVGVVVWSCDPGGSGSSQPPTKPSPDSAETTDLAAAEGLAAAFAHHDAAGAAPYLAPGTTAPWPEWPVHLKRDAAWGVRYLMEPCTPTTTGSATTVFSCPFALHTLGSRKLGKGPFLDNTLTVVVSDGKVISAESEIPYQRNGVQRHLESVAGWIADNHPNNEHFLLQDEMNVKRAEWLRWVGLWKQYIRDYVAATNAAHEPDCAKRNHLMGSSACVVP